MLPLRGFYGFESWLDHKPSTASGLINAADEMDGSGSRSRKSTEACKSHRDAERRRRQRINTHLSTLRSLLPNTTKSDKASLLAEVVEHVKRLRKQADDVAAPSGSVISAAEGEPWLFPGDSDEVTVRCCDGELPRRVTATVCCEDRPGLNRDLTHAIRSVEAKAVRAEMMTVGGRTKSVVVIQWPAEGDGGDVRAGEGEEVGALERALKAVIENRAFVGPEMGRVVLGQKRARDSCDVDSAFLSGNEEF